MNNISNLADTIIPKSDQLNADDLISGPRIITVTGVSRGNAESPLVINYDGDCGRPFKPCKTMRRLLILAWSENGNNWIGKSMQLYNDPTVKYAGVEVGGIRISHLTDIKNRITASLSATRGRKKQYVIDILQPPQKQPYPVDQFNASLEAMETAIKGGTMTAEQVINKCEQTGALNETQKQTIRDMES